MTSDQPHRPPSTTRALLHLASSAGGPVARPPANGLVTGHQARSERTDATQSRRNLLSAAIVYSLTVPLLLLDVWVTLYQRTCFPLYRIARVRRSPYFIFDRQKLRYLGFFDRLNCSFCTYANGVIAYVREVAARTEQYWCPIKHQQTPASTHSRYSHFVEYGERRDYRWHLRRLRRALEEPSSGHTRQVGKHRRR